MHVSFNDEVVLLGLLKCTAMFCDHSRVRAVVSRWKCVSSVNYIEKQEQQRPLEPRCRYCEECQNSQKPCPNIKARQERLRSAQRPFTATEAQSPQSAEEAQASAQALRLELTRLDQQTASLPVVVEEDPFEEYHIEIQNRLRAKKRAKAIQAEALGLLLDVDGSNCFFGGSTVHSIKAFVKRAAALVGFTSHCEGKLSQEGPMRAR